MSQRPTDLKNYIKNEDYRALTAERVFFIGKETEAFACHGRRIAHLMPRLDGVVVFRHTENEEQRIAEQLGVKVPCIDHNELLKLADNHRTTLVDFSESRVLLMWCQNLAKHPNITRCDFIQAFLELDRALLYEPLKKERAFVIDNLSAYDRVYDRLTDELSRQTLLSWLHGMLYMDRTPSFQTRVAPELEYMNGLLPQASIIPRPNEVYVDVGAASGDTVARFVNSCSGQYRKIVALEPNTASFGQLLGMKIILSNFSAYRYLAGDTAGLVGFFQDEVRPGASNALESEKSNTTVKQVKLDDLVPDATLIKMDVEGYETHVLRGAANIIRNNKPNMAVTTYHYARDFLNILSTVDGMHAYKYVALRQLAVNMHDFTYLFSDTQSFS